VLDGQHHGISQDTQDTLQWLLKTFPMPDLLNHLCIVFTHSPGNIHDQNRLYDELQCTGDDEQMVYQRSTSEIAPTIPIFVVDSVDSTSMELERNMTRFDEWMMTLSSLATANLPIVDLQDQIESEMEMKVFVDYRLSGPESDQYRYAIYEDRQREKMTPHNGDPVHYSEWRVIRQWEEEAGHQTITTRIAPHENEVKGVRYEEWVDFNGSSIWHSYHTFYTMYHTHFNTQQTITTHFDGSVTKAAPVPKWPRRLWYNCQGRQDG
jgi:hypothetical protein